MCGVIALLLADGGVDCAPELFDGLTVLQHRGQDAAGIVTASTSASWRDTHFKSHKDIGMVRDVFQEKQMMELQGNIGIGHCRYPTAGSSSVHEAQPMYVNYPCGLALAHNGNLTNADEERSALVRELRHLNTSSDSEVLLNIFGEELRKELEKVRPRDADGNARPVTPRRDEISPALVFNAVRSCMARCRGGYAVVMLIHNVGVLGFRDPWGIRPLCLGQRTSATAVGSTDYMLASESVALDQAAFTLMGDIAPGEAVLILPLKEQMDTGSHRKSLFRESCHSNSILSPCLFEHVYFARPDSVMDGVSVYEARLNMGKKLAEKIVKLYGPNHGIDVVIPVPDTARTSALECAETLGVPYREGFIKNRYIGRTFIMPGQIARRKGVRMKLNTVKSEFDNRCVLLVDDSVVRGTTATELVNMSREAGAVEVCIASASPEVLHANVYGIDVPTKGQLISHNRDAKEVAKCLGAKWVVFQDLTDLEDAIRSCNPNIKEFEGSVFSGSYVTKDITQEYLDDLEDRRPFYERPKAGKLDVHR